MNLISSSSGVKKYSRTSIVTESETNRLQRDIEKFTGELEKERRRSIVLDEDLKRVKKRLAGQKDYS